MKAEGTIDDWIESLLAAKSLAAQLAQGDISLELYQQQSEYSFGDMIKDVLGIATEEQWRKLKNNRTGQC